MYIYVIFTSPSSEQRKYNRKAGVSKIMIFEILFMSILMILCPNAIAKAAITERGKDKSLHQSFM